MRTINVPVEERDNILAVVKELPAYFLVRISEVMAENQYPSEVMIDVTNFRKDFDPIMAKDYKMTMASESFALTMADICDGWLEEEFITLTLI